MYTLCGYPMDIEAYQHGQSQHDAEHWDTSTERGAKRIKMREAGARARELFLDRSGMEEVVEEVVGSNRNHEDTFDDDEYHMELARIRTLIKRLQPKMYNAIFRSRLNRDVCNFVERWRDRPDVRSIYSAYFKSVDAKTQTEQRYNFLKDESGFYSTQADRELLGLAEKAANEASEWCDSLKDYVRSSVNSQTFANLGSGEGVYKSELAIVQEILQYEQPIIRADETKRIIEGCKSLACDFFEKWRGRIESGSDSQVRRLCALYFESKYGLNQLVLQLNDIQERGPRDALELAHDQVDQLWKKYDHYRDAVRTTVGMPHFKTV
jgi:hypothetical protein